MNKFIYFKTRQTFDSIKESFPANLSPLCFIEDTNEIWFNEHFFQAGHESINISEMDNVVTVSLSEDSFNIVPGSESISVSKGQGNNIIVSCNALTRIETDSHLEWKDNKLLHKNSGVESGSYGPSNNVSDTNIIPTISIGVDTAGHITDIKERTITIRDYTEQRKSDQLDKNRQILLAERDEDQNDTNITRKGRITFNNYSGVLETPKMKITGAEEQNVLIIDNGNIVVTNGYIEGKVKGDIEGYATPKIHISMEPDYGGASTKTYGHVMLVDEIPDNPSVSSDNEDLTDATIQAKAASPYAVKHYFDSHKMIVKAFKQDNELMNMPQEWQFGEDFLTKENKIEISWKEYLN